MKHSETILDISRIVLGYDIGLQVSTPVISKSMTTMVHFIAKWFTNDLQARIHVGVPGSLT